MAEILLNPLKVLRRGALPRKGRWL